MAQSFDQVYSAKLTIQQVLQDATADRTNTGKYLYNVNPNDGTGFSTTIDVTDVEIGYHWEVFQTNTLLNPPNPPLPTPYELDILAPVGTTVIYSALVNFPAVNVNTTPVTVSLTTVREGTIVGADAPETIIGNIALAGVKVEAVVVNKLFDPEEDETTIFLKIVVQEYAV